MVSKENLKDELVRVLEGNLEALERAHQASRAGATHEEAKPENDKDTRALEQSYLARGQAKRVEEMRTAVAEVRAMGVRPAGSEQPVALGRVVTVEENDGVMKLFVAPHGGGTVLASGSVQVVTPRSPLGRALMGKRVGEDCEVRLAERTRELLIVEIE